MKGVLLDYDEDFDIKEMIRTIDRMFVELEKNEKEESKEKEFTEAKKTKKQSNSKKRKDRQEKRKPICPDESEIGRSAEGVMPPFDD